MMQRYRMRHVIIVVSALLSFAGCKKKAGPPPDISNFSAYAPAAFVTGGKGTVVISSTSLPSGNYTVLYSYYTQRENRNSDTVRRQSATLVMNGNTGSFQTAPITDPYAIVAYVMINSIVSSSGSTSALTANNFVTIPDSTGMVNATFSNDSTFKTVYFTANADTNLSSIIQFDAQYFLPGSTDIDVLYISIEPYPHHPGTCVVDSGYGFYSHMSNNIYVSRKIINHGTLNVIASVPLLIGTLSLTFTDSTKLNGSFSTPLHFY